MNLKVTQLCQQDGLAVLLGDNQCNGCTTCLELCKHEGKAAASSPNDCQVLHVFHVPDCFQSAITELHVACDVQGVCNCELCVSFAGLSMICMLDAYMTRRPAFQRYN